MGWVTVNAFIPSCVTYDSNYVLRGLSRGPRKKTVKGQSARRMQFRHEKFTALKIMCVRSSSARIISQQLLHAIGTALLDAASGEINLNERPRNRQICPFMPAQSHTHARTYVHMPTKLLSTLRDGRKVP